MREFLLSNGPFIAALLAAGELFFGILLAVHYSRTGKQILLLMAIVSFALCFDASVLACGSFLPDGLLRPLSQMRLPLCAEALGWKETAKKAVWFVTLLIMAGGSISGLLTKLEPSSAAGITRYLSGEGTPAFAERFLRVLSYGTVVPLIITGIIVWIRRKTPFLFLAGFLMFAFSALGPATGNFDLIFLIGMFGELFMVLFFLLYGKQTA